MKRLAILTSLLLTAYCMNTPSAQAQGWPANYDGVMLQGFYWDSFSDTKWKKIEAQADELSQYFNLIWVPQSGHCGGTSMGYDVQYYWNQNSSFGTEEQLRSMIGALKERGTGVVADVVVNHRKNLSNWVDFPAETYQGVTYEMVSTDIVANDDGGATRTWATQNGYSLSANNDEGEGWDGMRDLDHKSANVQTCVKAYTKYLKEDLGYTGFRYDMVKGFDGSHVADYNRNAGIQYSVGEYWDGNAASVKSWINKTKVDGVPQSAAFDFPFRYTCRDAANGDWSKLKNTSVMSDASYRQFAVTFIENHDTEYRSSTAQQDPIRKDTLALNAWLLSMPGTPCVFLKHWQNSKSDIKNMIEVRRLVGINNQSTYTEFAANSSYCARTVQGTQGKLFIAAGNYTGNVGNDMLEVLSGKNYRMAVSKSLNTVWIGTPSGIFEEGETVQVLLTAITDKSDAQIVYTTDGSEPTATNGTKVASGTEISVAATTRLRAAIIANGAATGCQERSYTFKAPETNDYTPWTMRIYVRSDVASFNNKMNYYIWAGDDNEQLNGGWPGQQITAKTVVKGNNWFVEEISITRENLLPVNCVFSTGTGSPQTVDVMGITTAEAFFVIRNTQNGGKYNVDNVTSQYSAIDAILSDDAATQVFDLLGRRVSQMQPGQIYLQGNRKMIVR